MRVLVIGDSYTGGSDQGGVGAAGWPQLVASRLETAGYKVLLQVVASSGSGYVEPGPYKRTFLQEAEAAQGVYDLIVVFGSRNDTAPGAAVQQAATSTFKHISSAWPNARLVVIGPPWVNSDPPSNIVADEQAVGAAARNAGGVFIDPVADGWFAGSFSRLIGADGVHPTDAGHRHMADLILPALKSQLEDLAPGAVPGG